MVEQYPSLNRPERPVCSICIANFNGEALLDDCLASVLSQQGGISIEIIVHDDASTDASVALLRANYPQVELLASRENVGFCIGNNRMVQHARGQYVLLLNNDAALYPDALAALIDAERAHSSPGILTVPQYDWETGMVVDRGCLLDPFYNPVPNLDPERRDVAMVIGACLWIARETWQELGGFPEWFGSIGEDLYLCTVARLRCLPVGVTAGSGYRHRQGVSFGGNRATSGVLQTTFRRRYLSERNKTRAMVVCTPTPMVGVLLGLQLVLLTVEGFTLSLVRHDARIWQQIYYKAIKDVLIELPGLWRLRREQQEKRAGSVWGFLRNFVLTHRKLGLLRRYGVPRVH